MSQFIIDHDHGGNIIAVVKGIRAVVKGIIGVVKGIRAVVKGVARW